MAEISPHTPQPVPLKKEQRPDRPRKDATHGRSKTPSFHSTRSSETDPP